jgi:hypothetical protein
VQAVEDGDGREPVVEGGRVDEGLEGGAGLPAAAYRAIVGRCVVVPPAHHGEYVARLRVERDQRRLESLLAQPRQPLLHRLLRGELHGGEESRLHVPVRRVVVADLLAEGLPQVLLRVSRVRVGQVGGARHAHARRVGALLGGGADEPLLAHAGQHDLAARESAFFVRPGGKRRRRADEAGHDRGLEEAEVLGPLAVELPRHGLDAEGPRAEGHAVEVQLEDLVLGELLLDEHGQDGFLGLPPDRTLRGQEQRARELLRDRATALREPAAADVARDGAAQPDGVDAAVPIEAMVLDRDDRFAQGGRDLVQGDVAPVLVQREPGLAVAAVEDGVADPACQPMHGPGLLRGPAERDGAPDHHHEEGRPQDDVGEAGRGGTETGTRGFGEGARVRASLGEPPHSG